jgi:hypothetical protein
MYHYLPIYYNCFVRNGEAFTADFLLQKIGPILNHPV